MTDRIEKLISAQNYLNEQAKRLGSIIEEKEAEINRLKLEIDRLQNLDRENSINGMQHQGLTQSIIQNMNKQFEEEKKTWVEKTTRLQNKICELELKQIK